jgi:hypothetical protein
VVVLESNPDIPREIMKGQVCTRHQEHLPEISAERGGDPRGDADAFSLETNLMKLA